MKLKVNKKVIEFFKQNSSKVYIDVDEEYFYYPYWMRFDKQGLMKTFSFDHLSPNLKSALKEKREMDKKWETLRNSGLDKPFKPIEE